MAEEEAAVFGGRRSFRSRIITNSRTEEAEMDTKKYILQYTRKLDEEYIRSLDEAFTVTVEGPSDASIEELSELVTEMEGGWDEEDDWFYQHCDLRLVSQEEINDHDNTVDWSVVRDEDGTLSLDW